MAAEVAGQQDSIFPTSGRSENEKRKCRVLSRAPSDQNSQSLGYPMRTTELSSINPHSQKPGQATAAAGHGTILPKTIWKTSTFAAFSILGCPHSRLYEIGEMQIFEKFHCCP